MNRKTRLIIAGIVTVILAITATTVWAGSGGGKEGSLGHKIHEAHGTCNGAAINLGDATFKMTVAGKIVCSFNVIRTKIPNAIMGSAPEGTEFRSDGFTVEGGPNDGIGTLELCFAYSPKDAAKNAQIYAVFGSQSGTLPAVKQGTPAMLCAATGILNGTFAMIGDEK